MLDKSRARHREGERAREVVGGGADAGRMLHSPNDTGSVGGAIKHPIRVRELTKRVVHQRVVICKHDLI